MDTFSRLLAITLLSLLAGCATERASQRVATPRQLPQDRSEAPGVITPQAAPSPATDGREIVEPSRNAESLVEKSAIEPRTANVSRVQRPSQAQGTTRSQTLKNPQAVGSEAMPAARGSRQLTLSQERFLERNENSLLRVYVDMSKTNVLSIMSEYRAGNWVNPCKEEKLMDNNGRIYEVIFYLSRRPVQSRPLGERLMTPVIFRDDRVYAIGRYSLKKLRSNSHIVEATSSGCRHI
jgi:hypothetical protein